MAGANSRADIAFHSKNLGNLSGMQTLPLVMHVTERHPLETNAEHSKSKVESFYSTAAVRTGETGGGSLCVLRGESGAMMGRG